MTFPEAEVAFRDDGVLSDDPVAPSVSSNVTFFVATIFRFSSASRGAVSPCCLLLVDLDFVDDVGPVSISSFPDEVPPPADLDLDDLLGVNGSLPPVPLFCILVFKLLSSL